MSNKENNKDWRKYYVKGLDEINVLEETPGTKGKRESYRFWINTALTIVSAIAAIVAAVAAVLTYLAA